MHIIKAIFKVILGLVLVASGIALEGLWLTFCFGTIVIGIVMLIWFTPILFFPFAFVSLPGWRIFNDALQDFNPLNVAKVSKAVAPLILPQIEAIVRDGALRKTLDERVLAYVAALCYVVKQSPNLSLRNVIDITSTLYSGPNYKLDARNLNYCVDYTDNLKAFWEEARSLIPIAQSEMAAGHGNYLLRLAREDQIKRTSKQAY